MAVLWTPEHVPALSLSSRFVESRGRPLFPSPLRSYFLLIFYLFHKQVCFRGLALARYFILVMPLFSQLTQPLSARVA